MAKHNVGDSFRMTNDQLDHLLNRVETIGWNAAIEAAAEIVHNKFQQELLAEHIRKLKK